jgi:hypothetical protein
MAKSDSEKQGMTTNVTTVLSQNPETVLRNIYTLAEVHAKASIRLVCGITQFLIVRAYSADDNQRWNVDTSKDFLKAKLNEHGLKAAMSYRYIQTGHKLAQVMVKRYGLGGLMHDILSADNENKAFDMILRCVISHSYLPGDTPKPLKNWALDAEKKPRLSMDVLRVNLGLEQLDATKQPGYKPPQAAAVDPNNPGAALGPAVNTVPATKAKPDTIIARLRADKDMLKRIPEDVVIGAADVIGREKMAERLVSLMTIAEITQLQTAIAKRVLELAEKPAEQPAEQQQPIPADTDTGTVEEPVAEEGTATTSKRSRSRKRRAA